jgi:general secretion pathway protein K
MPIKDNKGVALVLVLVVIALLVSLVVDFTYTMQVDVTLAANQRDEIKALYAARSGVEIAKLMLQEDETEYDSLDEDWALFNEHPGYVSEDDEGRFKGAIEDEASKIAINTLIGEGDEPVRARLEQLDRLFVLLDIDLELIDAIVDWLDHDDTPGPSGAEDAYYEGLTPPYPCKDGPLASLEELLLVKGMTEEILYGDAEKEGLMHYLTIYSDGNININTASSVVLQCLSVGIEEGEAQTIISYREDEPFSAEHPLSDVPEMQDIYSLIHEDITYESSVFSMRVEGQVRGIKKVIYTVVKRHEEAVEPIFWRVE